MIKSLPLLPLMLCAFGALTPEWPARVDAEAILQYVRVLAGRDMEGRRSGTPGGEKAARYLADQFRKAGLTPLGDDGSYLQRYTYPSHQFTGPCGLSIVDEAGTRKLAYGSEFYILNLSGPGAFEGDVVFAGYGLSVPERGYDDYAGVDVTGKVVLCMEGAPGRPADWPVDRRVLYAKAREAAKRGARGLLFFPDPDKGRQLPEMHVWGFNKERWTPNLIVAKIDAPIADLILEGSGSTAALLKKQINSSGKPNSRATRKRVSLRADVEVVEETVAWNVIGGVPGSGDLAKETIVIGGHYDTGGVDPDGTLFPGAEDDASGVAITLELARTVVQSQGRPERSIVFAAWAAEEQGFSGHQYYLDQSPDTSGRMVAAFWLDNAGISDGSFHAYGAVFFPRFYNFLLTGLPDSLRGQIRPGAIGAFGFQDRGIPAIFTHATGPHAYNHTAHDAAFLIQREAVQHIGDFVLHATGRLANTRVLPYRVTDVEDYWLRSSVLATAALHDVGRIPALAPSVDKTLDERRLPELLLVTLPRARLSEVARLRSDLTASGWALVRDVTQVTAGSPPGALLVVDAPPPDELSLWWDLGARMVQVKRGTSQERVDEAKRAGFKLLVRDPRALEALRMQEPIVLWPVDAPFEPRRSAKLLESNAVVAIEFHAQSGNGRPSNGPLLHALLTRLKELRRDLPQGQILLAPSYAPADETVSLSDVVTALRKEGWSRTEVSGILGGHFTRVLRTQGIP
ncbi:MAG: M20/M25/M40 family metallo-hydrolase [Acidobacteria bacterium]|nr:M20/M25/M40 family metallo-hydrolase [Acidobacteriota bacterium]